MRGRAQKGDHGTSGRRKCGVGTQPPRQEVTGSRPPACAFSSNAHSALSFASLHYTHTHTHTHTQSMPSAVAQPPSAIEHLKGHLDVPRTPSPGACALTLPALPGRLVEAVQLADPSRSLSHSPRHYQGGRPRVRQGVIRRQGRPPQGSSRRALASAALERVCSADRHSLEQIVTENGFLPDALCESECVAPSPHPP